MVGSRFYLRPESLVLKSTALVRHFTASMSRPCSRALKEGREDERSEGRRGAASLPAGIHSFPFLSGTFFAPSTVLGTEDTVRINRQKITV